MKIYDFYREDASEDWFTTEAHWGAVHANLENNGFSILSHQTMVSKCHDLTVPINQAQLSWGAILPAPIQKFQTVFIAASVFELEPINYQGKPIEDIINDWMGLMPGEKKYIISLNPAHYLFAESKNVTVKDPRNVIRGWSLDSYVGIFDDSQTVMFVFDAEFEIIYVSFDPTNLPESFGGMREMFNTHFTSVFVRDAKVRTGADTERAEEYFLKALAPAIHG